MKGRDLWLNVNSLALLVSLAHDPYKELTKAEEAIAAYCIKSGLLRKTDKPEVMLPVFTRETLNTVNFGKAVSDIAVKYSDLLCEELERILLPYVRKDLMSNFLYWDMKRLLQPIEYLFCYGVESKALEIPENYDCSAAGLNLVVEQQEL